MKKLLVLSICLSSFFYFSRAQYNKPCKGCSEEFKKYSDVLIKITTDKNSCIENQKIFWEQKDTLIKHLRILKDLVFLYANSPGESETKSILLIFKKNLNNFIANSKTEDQLNYLKFIIPYDLKSKKKIEKEIWKRKFKSWNDLNICEKDNTELFKLYELKLI